MAHDLTEVHHCLLVDESRGGGRGRPRGGARVVVRPPAARPGPHRRGAGPARPRPRLVHEQAVV
ncbi:hypothetical protein, partial [Nocardia wallacei]|uniref:hypothetical protein n=1 Tax=Nocardia wallacei TaxID=480035 RepID=UPI0024568394